MSSTINNQVKHYRLENKKIKDSLTFTKNIIKHASEGIIVYDSDLKYTLWNDFMVNITGLKANEVLGKSTYEIFNRENFDTVQEGLKKALSGETVVLNELQFTNPQTKRSGFTREVFSPNYDSEGNIIGVVCFVSDITDLVQTKNSLKAKNLDLITLNTKLTESLAELEIAKNRIEKSNRLKTVFLAHMSHEIRSPLNSIIGFSLLLKDVKDETLFEKYTNIIKSNNLLLLNTIDDILTFSELETSSVKIIISEVNLQKLFQNLYNNFKNICTSKVKLINKLHPCNIVIQTDEKLLSRILTNLITNSLKFTETGYIEFGVKDIDDSKVTCYVKDTGIGIAEENQIIIFNRFHKLDSIKYGSGLGLSNCQELIEKLNGKIYLESQYQVGSTFFVEIPILNKNQGDLND